MEKIKEFFSNKKNITIFGIIFGVIVLIIIALLLFNVFNSTARVKADLESELKEMGKDFYENFYYDLVVKDHGTEQISKFSQIGIKIDLDNLERYKSENSEKIAKFKNPKTNNDCNKENTKIIIYPEDPYGKTNYRLETQLSCGFEESK